MSDLQPFDKSFLVNPFGLNNTGVICYFNSLLQSLVSCPIFVETVLSSYEYLQQTNVGRALYVFVLNAKNDKVPSSASILMALKLDMCKRLPHDKFGQSQEDSAECLIKLLNMLDDPDKISPTNTNVLSCNPISKLFYSRYITQVVCNKCSHKTEPKSEKHLIYRVNTTNKSIVQFPKNPTDFGISMVKYASVTDEYKCDNCSEINTCYVTYKLTYIPEIIVVSFINIYTDEFTGHSHESYVPESIILPGHENDLMFKSVAQIAHYGNRSGGHYISYGLRSNNKYYQFNDNSISAAHAQVGLKNTQNIYMSFYQFS